MLVTGKKRGRGGGAQGSEWAVYASLVSVAAEAIVLEVESAAVFVKGE